ncbi:MAG: DUF721 domain-containing protein [Desulfobacteraceae bacterium]|jgi:predicted nucleic acid-binding Zn ribbon protein
MNSSDKKNQPLVHIGPIIETLLSSYRTTSKTSVGKLTRIVKVWATVVGTAIADNTKPVSLKEKLLLVNVTSSVWVQQLHFIKGDLINRLNIALGEDRIEDIKFRVGQVR